MFAESVNERAEPADAADEIYVGLDDLETDSHCTSGAGARVVM